MRGRLEKMAEQLGASVSEHHGDGAEAYVVLMGAFVFEEGRGAVLHDAQYVSPHPEPPDDKDVIVGALKTWIDDLDRRPGERAARGKAVRQVRMSATEPPRITRPPPSMQATG